MKDLRNGSPRKSNLDVGKWLDDRGARNGDVIVYSDCRTSEILQGIVIYTGACRCGKHYEIMQRMTYIYEDFEYIIPLALFQVRTPALAKMTDAYSRRDSIEGEFVPLYSAIEMASYEAVRPLIRRVK